MKIASKTQKELAAIRTSLLRAVDAPEQGESRRIIRRVIRRIDLLAEQLSKTQAELGREGGLKTAERGPDYFRQIAAMRKTRGGGRPRKQTE